MNPDWLELDSELISAKIYLVAIRKCLGYVLRIWVSKVKILPLRAGGVGRIEGAHQVCSGSSQSQAMSEEEAANPDGEAEAPEDAGPPPFTINVAIKVRVPTPRPPAPSDPSSSLFWVPS